MQENKSITFEQNSRMLTKRDGSKEPFEGAELKAFLEQFLEGLATDHMNIDLIVDKVSKGIYNGKSPRLSWGKPRHSWKLALLLA